MLYEVITPAVFMTSVVVTYILIAPEGFNLPYLLSYAVGIISALALCIGFFVVNRKEISQVRVAPVRESK